MKKVLFVEDMPQWHKAIQSILVPPDFELHIASTFEQAKRRIFSMPFDLVLINLCLEDEGDYTGVALLEDLVGSNMPRIVLTGTGATARGLFERYKVYDVLYKGIPFNKAQFRQTVIEAIAQRGCSSVHSVEASSTPRCRITWLHFSDLHIGCREESRDWDSLKDSLLRDIEEHQKPGSRQPGRCAGTMFRPDLIFITGDIAYRGGREEYVEAKRLLRSIWEITGLGEELGKARTFVVPGNHDVTRKEVEEDPLHEAAYNQLVNQEMKPKAWLDMLNKWWDYHHLHELWARKFAQYLRFVQECTTISTERGYYAQSLQISGVDLAIIGLNSALMSWKDSEDLARGLWIGKPQLDEIERDLSKDAFRITLVHHPREVLHSQDVAWERIQEISHLVLHGHMHRLRVVPIGELEREHVCLPGGSVHEDGVWNSQHYSYGQLDLESGELDIYLRMTKSSAYPVYIRDNQTYPNAASDGHLRVLLSGDRFTRSGLSV